ncbi:MAG: hypothetical protein RLY21_2584 [Planctomycetota bacterium]|jgi:MYXO-CTERM domain-containing protein
MRLTLSIAAYAALTISTASLADVIVDQPASASGDAASQVFPDPYAAYSCSAFDDFTIAESYNLTALRVYGTDSAGGNSAFNIAVTVKFYTDPNLNNAAVASATGSQIGGDLVFDLTGITLNAGTYWIAAQVERPFDGGGQWFWRVSDTTNGAQALWQNPNGGFGYGSNPIPLTTLGQSAYDMAFKLEGVPTPGAIALLGLGALAGRRRRA